MRKLLRFAFGFATLCAFLGDPHAAKAEILSVPLTGWTFAGSQEVSPGVNEYSYYTFVTPFGADPIGVVFGADSPLPPEFASDGIRFSLPAFNSADSLRFRFFGTGGFPPGTTMSVLFDVPNPRFLSCTGSDGNPIALTTSPALISSVNGYNCSNNSFIGLPI